MKYCEPQKRYIIKWGPADLRCWQITFDSEIKALEWADGMSRFYPNCSFMLVEKTTTTWYPFPASEAAEVLKISRKYNL